MKKVIQPTIIAMFSTVFVITFLFSAVFSSYPAHGNETQLPQPTTSCCEGKTRGTEHYNTTARNKVESFVQRCLAEKERVNQIVAQRTGEEATELATSGHTQAITFVNNESEVGQNLHRHLYFVCEAAMNNCLRAGRTSARDHFRQYDTFRSHASGGDSIYASSIAAHKERWRMSEIEIPRFCRDTIGSVLARTVMSANDLNLTQRYQESYARTVRGESGGASGGGLKSFIGKHPWLAMGGAAALGGLLGYKMGQKKGKKEGKKEVEDKEKAESDKKHNEMVQLCTGENSSNTNTVECSDHFVKACTSESGKNKEGCEEYNENFCGHPPSQAHQKTSSVPQGLNSHIQYCTLVHSRSYCHEGNNQNSPSCEWLVNVRQSSECQDNPLQGNCLPRFTSPESLMASCANYNIDPVCYRTLNGQRRFVITYTNGEKNNKSATQSMDLANYSPPLSLPSGRSTGTTLRSPASSQDIQPLFSGNILSLVSATRKLCNQGKLYNCE